MPRWPELVPAFTGAGDCSQISEWRNRGSQDGRKQTNHRSQDRLEQPVVVSRRTSKQRTSGNRDVEENPESTRGLRDSPGSPTRDSQKGKEM